MKRSLILLGSLSFSLGQCESSGSALRPLGGAVRLVEVHVSDPGLVEELADSLRRSAFRVLLTGSTTLMWTAEHLGPGAIEGAIELELDLYLQVWEVTHPGVRATRLKRR